MKKLSQLITFGRTQKILNKKNIILSFSEDLSKSNFLRNKSQNELKIIKELLNKKIKDNQKLQLALNDFKNTEYDKDFKSFQLF